MSGQEDFSPLVEALVACVGVVDVIALLGYMFSAPRVKPARDLNNNDIRVRDKPPKTDAARSIPHVVVDGVEPGGDVIDSLVAKVNELEAKVSELEILSRENSMERFVEIERYRRSRSPSPYPNAGGSRIKDEESSSYDDESTATSSSTAESRAGSVRQQFSAKLIARDDEFRKPKRSSQTSHESREDELKELSKLEQEEAENMGDFVPITYEGQDNAHYRHGISPIQEMAHGDIERSPEPGMSSMTDKPWGDIKRDAAEIIKHERKDQMRRSLSIDEQPQAEERATPTLPDITEPVATTNVNEQFIKMEQNAVQRSSPKLLLKQAHFSSEDQQEESASELESVPMTPIEIIQSSEVWSQNEKENSVSVEGSPQATTARENVSSAPTLTLFATRQLTILVSF